MRNMGGITEVRMGKHETPCGLVHSSHRQNPRIDLRMYFCPTAWRKFRARPNLEYAKAINERVK